MEIEKSHARERAWFLPVVEFVAGRHEDKFSAAIAYRRGRQTLNRRAAVVPHSAFIHHQHMDGREEVEIDPSPSVGLYDLDPHAGPSHATAVHSLGW